MRGRGALGWGGNTIQGRGRTEGGVLCCFGLRFFNLKRGLGSMTTRRPWVCVRAEARLVMGRIQGTHVGTLQIICFCLKCLLETV